MSNQLYIPYLILLPVLIIFVHSIYLLFTKRLMGKQIVIFKEKTPYVYTSYIILLLMLLYGFISNRNGGMIEISLETILWVVMLASSLGGVIKCRNWLASYYSPTIEIVEGHQLIKKGLYKYIAHPMYYLETIAAICCTILVNSAYAYVGLAVWFVSIWFKIRAEDKILSAHFPKEYRSDYSRLKSSVSKLGLTSKKIPM